MTMQNETLWEITPHTKAKHEILRRYLQAWFPILNRHHGRIIYIDGFCGPGRYKGGEIGSPLIVLDAAITHRKEMRGELIFLFIDERKDRITHLQQELKTRSIPTNFKVFPKCGRFQEKLEQVFRSIEEGTGRLAPTFMFVDPFGISGIPFPTIERLLMQKGCEALITFMVDPMNRWLEHPNEGITQHIVEAFGTKECLKIANESDGRIIALRALYQRQLDGVAKFVRDFEIRDCNDRILYYLFFATNNSVGHLKMKEAMRKIDPDGEFRFSDATDPNQMVLFEADITSILIKLFRDQFKEKGYISCEEVRRYVENETAYLKKDMTKALKQEELAGRVCTKPMKTDGAKRIKNTYPDGAMITFT